LIAAIDAWEGFPNAIPVTSWTDVGTTVGSGPHKLWYYIVAVNNELLESLPSNNDWIAWNKYGKKSSDEGFVHNINYSLEQNYPNPFNPSTIFNVNLEHQSNVKLLIYSILGEQVFAVEKFMLKGTNKIKFNAGNLGSGIYYIW
jgi:hypothetical protein